MTIQKDLEGFYAGALTVFQYAKQQSMYSILNGTRTIHT